MGMDTADALVLLELRGNPDDDWFWHSDSAATLQRHTKRDDDMRMGIVAKGEMLDPTVAYVQYLAFCVAGARWGVGVVHLKPV